MEELSRILLLTWRLTGRMRHAGGDFYYRSAASAGALYPTEIYAAVLKVSGLQPGLYHFSIAHHGLSLLRKGDLTEPIIRATHHEGNRTPLLVFFLSAIFFRSSWKYRDRSYRYHLMDTGHVIENMLLALRSVGCGMSLSYDFDDPSVNHLLGLDPKREACLAVCHVPGSHEIPEAPAAELEELPGMYQAASQVAEREIDYPALHEIHAAGSRIVSANGGSRVLCRMDITPREWKELDSPDNWPETLPYPDVVFERRSKRNFTPGSLPRPHLSFLLDGLCREIAPSDHEAISTGFLAGNVEGLDPGFYVLDPENHSMGTAATGSFMDRMTRICLGQEWLANAALHFLFMADLQGLEERWGARGYRYAMMSAGRLGERLYVAATALGLGCCGIGAFYDDEAASLLSLQDFSRLLYLVAVGPVKRT
jgi:SagB-type dehydrogenase family enzyme